MKNLPGSGIKSPCGILKNFSTNHSLKQKKSFTCLSDYLEKIFSGVLKSKKSSIFAISIEKSTDYKIIN